MHAEGAGRVGARPIDADSDSVVFPADGRHLGFSNLDRSDGEDESTQL